MDEDRTGCAAVAVDVDRQEERRCRQEEHMESRESGPRSYLSGASQHWHGVDGYHYLRLCAACLFAQHSSQRTQTKIATCQANMSVASCLLIELVLVTFRRGEAKPVSSERPLMQTSSRLLIPFSSYYTARILITNASMSSMIRWSFQTVPIVASSSLFR